MRYFDVLDIPVGEWAIVVVAACQAESNDGNARQGSGYAGRMECGDLHGYNLVRDVQVVETLHCVARSSVIATNAQ